MVVSKMVGAVVRRKEDPRLITGTATYVDDVKIPGILHAAFLRSQIAHGTILPRSRHPEETLTNLAIRHAQAVRLRRATDAALIAPTARAHSSRRCETAASASQSCRGS